MEEFFHSIEDRLNQSPLDGSMVPLHALQGDLMQAVGELGRAAGRLQPPGEVLTDAAAVAVAALRIAHRVKALAEKGWGPELIQPENRTQRAFVEALTQVSPPEPCQRRNAIPKFVVNEPGWKGCDGIPY